ncbi:discoidin domain-containing protein [Paenibacillus sp. FSL R10-2734]|uniref:discoidin domain-containing protein n=1 Tax=Paenibacillus sp. FSL R10-2734 TaxID=2954691 RepID=UPI0030D91894
MKTAKGLWIACFVTCLLIIGLGSPFTTQAKADPALRLTVNNTHPLNMIGFYYSDSSDLVQLWNSVPDNQKPYSTILLIAENSLNNTATVKNWITARLDEAEANNISVMVQAINGETKKSTAIPISWFEGLMQNYTSLKGFNAAELYNSIPWYGQTEGNHSQYLADLLNMTSQYGGLFVWSDTNIFSANGTVLDWIQNNSNLIEAMRAHKDNFAFIYKESFTDRSSDSLGLGLFLSGLAGNWGTSSDWWHWQLAGYGQLFGNWNSANGDWKQIFTYPESMYVMDMIRAASEGATIFKSEAGWYSTSNQGRLTPGYVHATLPYLNKILDGSIHIPTRAEVLAKNKFAYIGRPAFSVPYESNYSAIFMKTGRYGIIPLLPTNSNAAELANFENTSTVAKNEAYFQSLYPEETYATDTFASRNGNTWYWMNSSENTDIFQSSTLKPQVNTSGYFNIGANPHTYAVITESADTFNVHLNNYRVNKSSIYNGTSWDKAAINSYIYNTYSTTPDDTTLRNTIIKVSGNYNGDKPTLSITGDNGFTYTETWNASSNLYTLSIMHNGPVDLVIGVNSSVTTAPTIPTGLAGSVIDSHSVNITWDSTANAIAYDVETDGVVSSSLDASSIISGFPENTTHTFRVRAKNTVGASAWSAPVSVTTLPNVALNKPATAQVTASGYSPAAANDSNLSNFWDGGSYPSWWQVDLQGNYNINNIGINTYADGRYYKYTIQASTDGTNWTNIAEKTNNNPAAQVADSYNVSTIARYLRVNITYNSANQSAHISDFQVHGTAVSTNVALDKPATAQFTASGYSPSSANDSNTSSFWDGGSYPSWWQVDLEGIYNITSIKLSNYYSDTRYYHYTIEASTDNTNWTQIAAKTNNTVETSSGVTIPVSATVRYVRVNITHNSANGSAHIKDIQIF